MLQPLHRKFICNRYLFGLNIFLALLFYIIIYMKLPDTSCRVKLDSETIEIKESKFQEHLTKDNLADQLTIIIREFEEFDNALSSTLNAIKETLGQVPVLIVTDKLPYPPVNLISHKGAKIITLAKDLTKNYSSACPVHFIFTRYVLVIPDGVKIRDFQQVENFVSFLHAVPNTTAVAVPVGENLLQCQDFNVDLKRWSIIFNGNYSESTFHCPLVKGAHGLFMEAETLRLFSDPFVRPFPYTFYVQAKVKNLSIRILKSERLDIIFTLYMEPHSNWKHKRAETERLHSFYRAVGVKQEILASGESQFYGCSKTTPRCFGTVIDDMPDYLYQGRWTPPCCLKALRETLKHVLMIFEQLQIRYWLEGGSLLGAVRHKDIIPWDYDIDIGVYKEDLEKCPPLIKAREEHYMDEQGYVWEKATEGDFYRVQYSEINHLHVDIYPFYVKDGIMTKDTWFPTHRQDTEFPEKFLQPMIRIEFAGIIASAPNNVRHFLEYKFGEGVIEQPKYPDLQTPL